MRRTTPVLLVALLAAGLSTAQQPNSVRATMEFNGVAGPPFPITGAYFPRGMSSTVLITGLPNSPFVVAGANGLRSAGWSALGGLVDLNAQGYAIAVNGLTSSTWALDGNGQFAGNCPVPSSAGVGTQRAFQGMVADFTSPYGATLTAATIVTVSLGITTLPISLGEDDSFNVNLTPYGITLPFYTQTYSNIWVNANGFLSFGSGTTDYIPTSSAFISQMPRVCGYWTDLSPQVGGTINFIVDQSTPLAFVRCNFTNVAEFATSTPHTFSMSIYTAIGDVVIAESGFNPQALIDVIVGITPGNNLGPQPSRNLSNLNLGNYPQGGLLGAVNENFHEFFPLAGGGNPWDLAGRTISCSGIGIGTSSAQYRVLVYP